MPVGRIRRRASSATDSRVVARSWARSYWAAVVDLHESQRFVLNREPLKKARTMLRSSPMREATITSFESVRVRPYLSKRRLLAKRLSIKSQRVAIRSGVLSRVAAIASEVVIVQRSATTRFMHQICDACVEAWQHKN